MDINYIKKLIHLVEHANVDELEIEEEGLKVRIAKHAHSVAAAPAQIVPPSVIAQPAVVHSAPMVVEFSAPKAPSPAANLHEIKSPIVGTFYLAPAPDAPHYVEIGQTVEAGTVLCIIEAMKLMNEIDSDMRGKVVKILVENGQPVEYNQPLFLIEPA